MSLAYTLLADGTSDRALLPILDWLLVEHSRVLFNGSSADLSRLPDPPRDLAARVQLALELYPCDLLFVHRDAERASREGRRREIRRAIASLVDPPSVCVVPVRMTEAWLLFDAAAIRLAAGNPNGTAPLDLPGLRDVESIPDPKRLLIDLIRAASELTGRRLKKLRPRCSMQRLATAIENFADLRRLPAFAALERDLGSVLTERGWASLDGT